MLYMLVWTSKRATLESVRALNPLPACTVNSGQSDTSPMVFWSEECPPHSSSSLLREGFSSLKDQSCCQNLMKSLKGNPGWWQLWGGGVYGGLRVLGIAWLSWAEVFVLCGGSWWSETGSGLWSGMSGTHRRSGECGMEFDCAWWYHGMRGNGSIHQLRGGRSCCGGWTKSMRCAF